MLTQSLFATLELLRTSGPHTITITPFLASLSPGLSSMVQGPVAAVLPVSKRLLHSFMHSPQKALPGRRTGVITILKM